MEIDSSPLLPSYCNIAYALVGTYRTGVHVLTSAYSCMCLPVPADHAVGYHVYWQAALVSQTISQQRPECQ